ncbi:MAG TPA: hypothetical protein VI339_02345 [Steroidobacteraceae bacterium]|nr:hypothetical protein [Steroidobacteraceae bacterium]
MIIASTKNIRLATINKVRIGDWLRGIAWGSSVSLLEAKMFGNDNSDNKCRCNSDPSGSFRHGVFEPCNDPALRLSSSRQLSLVIATFIVPPTGFLLNYQLVFQSW